jgi:hypothetical protein
MGNAPALRAGLGRAVVNVPLAFNRCEPGTLSGNRAAP